MVYSLAIRMNNAHSKMNESQTYHAERKHKLLWNSPLQNSRECQVILVSSYRSVVPGNMEV